jgi:hypothetical protein
MIRNFLCFVFLLLCFPSWGQYTINNPFTRWGIGELAMGENATSRAMGGVTILPSEFNVVNLNNTASFSLLKETTFQGGGWVSQSKYSPSAPVYNGGQWGEVAMGFKQNGSNFGFAMGVNTYSRMGYNFSREFSVNDTVNGQQLHYGDGGVNQFVFGAGYKWNWGADSTKWMGQQLSLGINGAFMFGKLGFHRAMDYENTQFLNSRFDNTVSVLDIRPDFSAQYQIPLFGNTRQKDKKSLWLLNLGAQWTPKFNMDGSQDIYGISYLKYSGVDVTVDTGFVSLNQKGMVAIPQRIQLGGFISCYGKNGAKWNFAAQFNQQDWRKSQSSFDWSAYADLNNATSLHLGVACTPFSPDRATNLFQNIQYRVGYSQGQDYVKVNAESVSVQSYTAGINVPIRASKSNSSIQVSYQWTNKKNQSGWGMQQEFIALGFQMSPFERWFVIRKYD